MQASLTTLSTRLRLTFGALIAAGLAGLFLVLSVPEIERYFLSRPSVCLLKVFSGVPCLACRGTRAAFALSHGNFPSALAFNPLATLSLLGAATYLGAAFLSGRSIRVRLSRPETRLFWIGVVFVLLGNWIYVIRAGG